MFEGPVTLDGSKLKTLVRWAAGARDMSGQATAGAFTFSAKTVIGGGDLKLEDASGELSGTKFSGALHYRGGEHRVVDLTLDSDRLDLREVLGESAAWQSWLPDPAAAQGTAPRLRPKPARRAPRRRGACHLAGRRTPASQHPAWPARCEIQPRQGQPRRRAPRLRRAWRRRAQRQRQHRAPEHGAGGPS